MQLSSSPASGDISADVAFDIEGRGEAEIQWKTLMINEAETRIRF